MLAAERGRYAASDRDVTPYWSFAVTSWRPPPDWLAAFVRSRRSTTAASDAPAGATDAMHLFGTIGYEALLAPDGAVWINDTEDWCAAELVWRWRRAPRGEALGAIKVAAERIPELGALVPARPADVPACAACRGSGILTLDGGAVHGVWCQQCFGLGWRVPDDPSDRSASA
jgi:hypothetical protein